MTSLQEKNKPVSSNISKKNKQPFPLGRTLLMFSIVAIVISISVIILENIDFGKQNIEMIKTPSNPKSQNEQLENIEYTQHVDNIPKQNLTNSSSENKTKKVVREPFWEKVPVYIFVIILIVFLICVVIFFKSAIFWCTVGVLMLTFSTYALVVNDAQWSIQSIYNCIAMIIFIVFTIIIQIGFGSEILKKEAPRRRLNEEEKEQSKQLKKVLSKLKKDSNNPELLSSKSNIQDALEKIKKRQKLLQPSLPTWIILLGITLVLITPFFLILNLTNTTFEFWTTLFIWLISFFVIKMKTTGKLEILDVFLGVWSISITIISIGFLVEGFGYSNYAKEALREMTLIHVILDIRYSLAILLGIGIIVKAIRNQEKIILKNLLNETKGNNTHQNPLREIMSDFFKPMYHFFIAVIVIPFIYLKNLAREFINIGKQLVKSNIELTLLMISNFIILLVIAYISKKSSPCFYEYMMEGTFRQLISIVVRFAYFLVGLIILNYISLALIRSSNRRRALFMKNAFSINRLLLILWVPNLILYGIYNMKWIRDIEFDHLHFYTISFIIVFIMFSIYQAVDILSLKIEKLNLTHHS